MPPFGPISRRELVRCLRDLGFTERYRQGAYEYLKRPGGPPVKIPNPHHQEDISRSLLSHILDQAGVSREDWEMV